MILYVPAFLNFFVKLTPGPSVRAGAEAATGPVLLDDVVLVVADPVELHLGAGGDRLLVGREEVVADLDRGRGAGAGDAAATRRPGARTRLTRSRVDEANQPSVGSQTSAGSSSASRRRFGSAPTTRLVSAPSRNRIRVGIESTS